MPRRRLAALLLALAASLGAAGGLATVGFGDNGFGPAAARAIGPLPACRYDDILTTPRRYVDWSITLVDTILRVPSTYAPPDLVPVADAGLAGSGKVRAVAVADLKAMTDAASAAGTPIAVQSAYRSYAQQKVTFQSWVDRLGYSAALKVSARPGHSEHQLGLAIDFRSDQGGPPWEGGDWALSPAGSWMKANAWTYGWVLSYPRNEFSKVCYSYEPWHYRYVGRDLAKKIHDAKLTIREYLWANFTTAQVPPPASGSPAPTSRPSPSDRPAPSPSLFPTFEPTLKPTVDPTATTEAPTLAPTPEPTIEPASPTGLGGPTGMLLAAVGLATILLIAAGAWFISRKRGRRNHAT
jgi:D-alanyl-D-alanine carboxypeptidase